MRLQPRLPHLRGAPERAYEHHDDVEHTHSHGHGWKGILLSATKHTVQVTLFIFVITIVLNIVLETVGEEPWPVSSVTIPPSPFSPRRSWGLFPTAPPALSSPSCMWRGAGSRAMLPASGVGRRGPARARAGESPLAAECGHHRAALRHRRVLGARLQRPGRGVLKLGRRRPVARGQISLKLTIRQNIFLH